MNNTNDFKTIGNLVAMQGWIEEKEEGSKFSLHLHVSFDEARLGGGPESNVTFRLKVSTCQVQVEIPSGENVTYDKNSVDMDVPMQAQIKRVIEVAKNAGLDANANLSMSDFGAKFEAAFKGQKSESRQEGMEFSIPVISAEYRPSGPRTLCWQLRPEIDKFLQGPVWNAKDEPRLVLVDKRSAERKVDDIRTGFQPVVRVELRCKREDIHLLDISFKDEEKTTFLKKKPNFKELRLAAEGYLKTVLFREGLEVGNLEDIFSELVLADYIMSLEP